MWLFGVSCGPRHRLLTRVWSVGDINQGQTGGAHTAGHPRLFTTSGHWTMQLMFLMKGLLGVKHSVDTFVDPQFLNLHLVYE